MVSFIGDIVIERHAVCASANLMENSALHSRMLEDRGLPPLVALALSDDASSRGEACRCVANLSVNADMHQVSGVLNCYYYIFVSILSFLFFSHKSIVEILYVQFLFKKFSRVTHNHFHSNFTQSSASYNFIIYNFIRCLLKKVSWVHSWNVYRMQN